VSEFFKDQGGSEEKSFIPPDYSELMKEEELPFDADLSGDDDDDDGELVSDEEIEHDKIVEELEEGKPSMSFGSGFGSTSSKPTWGTSWGDQGNKQENNGWWGSGNSQQQNNGWWGSGSGGNNGWGTPKTGNQNDKPINRDKKVIFIDFFDGLMETYQSNGQAGFLPRAVYDLKPRFEVWTKIAAFNPSYVFGIVQKEFLNDINGIEGWSMVLEGWCCCLSSFLRKQYGCAQILLSTSIYQPKDWVISNALANLKKEDCIYIGLQSGLYNQSNQDLVTAQKCGIDYVDLNQLLNNMY
jgi:hypothetical protein